jgi:hypothetical protein
MELYAAPKTRIGTDHASSSSQTIPASRSHGEVLVVLERE